MSVSKSLRKDHYRLAKNKTLRCKNCANVVLKGPYCDELVGLSDRIGHYCYIHDGSAHYSTMARVAPNKVCDKFEEETK